uniref:Uncharacterized protein n=1 Tax=Pyrodinium bahamense TaxID=73915 RepID=A0A7S0AR27_9DINO|mmetsp:Transcript_40356/g.112061  ORF Transcript_40356/g.112061 Transcript_40356/m.112061 type:complete len:201 (+) Transcript_40356:65-667(+)
MGRGAEDPAKNDDIWKNVCTKELTTWTSPLRNLNATTPSASLQSYGDGGSYYRVPVAGEPVTVSGMRRRPELNGARGEIVNGALDEHGRVTVRVWDSMPGAGSSRKMKIQPFRLVPSGSAPALGASFKHQEDDRSSVRSVSRPGSMLSGVGSRALGSAISSSAQGALAGGRRFPTPAPSDLLKAGRTPSASRLAPHPAEL